MSLLFELLRQGRHGLTISRSLTCYEADLFLATGMADRIVTSWVGIGLPWGLSPVLRHYVEKGLAAYEEWSHLALGLRLKAGAMGVPFLPTMTMLGSDLAEQVNAATVRCPYTDQELLAVPALVPDVTLLHVHRADMYGNAQIDGYTHMDVDMARASRRVVSSAERIVTTEEITATPDRTVASPLRRRRRRRGALRRLPARVLRPLRGRHPTFRRVRVASCASTVRTRVCGVYVEANVKAYPDFEAFLGGLDPGRLAELGRLARELTP